MGNSQKGEDQPFEMAHLSQPDVCGYEHYSREWKWPFYKSHRKGFRLLKSDTSTKLISYFTKLAPYVPMAVYVCCGAIALYLGGKFAGKTALDWFLKILE